MFAVLADRCSAHKLILLAKYTATALLRFSLSVVQSFGLVLVLVVLMEVCNSPINIIVDAAVMGAGGVRIPCSDEVHSCPWCAGADSLAYLPMQEREYGRARLWGAVGWGCLAPAAGAVVARFGIRATFVCNIAIAALGFVPTLLLPIGSLREQRPPEAAGGPPDKASEKLHPHGSSIDVHADSAARSPTRACVGAATPPASASAAAGGDDDVEAGEAGPKPKGEAAAGRPACLPSTAHEHLEETFYDVAAHVPPTSAPELLVPPIAISSAAGCTRLAACRPGAAYVIRDLFVIFWLQDSQHIALHVVHLLALHPPSLCSSRCFLLQAYDMHTATWRAPHERARSEVEEGHAPAFDEHPALCPASAELGTGHPRFNFANSQGNSNLEQPLLPPEPAEVGMLPPHNAFTTRSPCDVSDYESAARSQDLNSPTEPMCSRRASSACCRRLRS